MFGKKLELDQAARVRNEREFELYIETSRNRLNSIRQSVSSQGVVQDRLSCIHSEVRVNNLSEQYFLRPRGACIVRVDSQIHSERQILCARVHKQGYFPGEWLISQELGLKQEDSPNA